MKNNEATGETQMTKHIAMLTRKDGWGVKCWHCDFQVRNIGGKFEAKAIADKHSAEAK